MLNYIFDIILYTVFFVLIIVFKMNPSFNKKTVSLSIAIPFFSVILQTVSEWIIYILVYLFGDIKSFYFTTGFIINFLELFIPFITILAMARINGIKTKIGMAFGISTLFIVLSFCLKFVILNGDWNIYSADTVADIMENATIPEALDEGKETAVMGKALMIINIIPAAVLAGFFTASRKKERQRSNLPKRKD